MELEVYNDTYYNTIKTKMITEKNNIIEKFNENKIDYFPSDTYFILLQVNKSKKKIEEELDKHNIILYKSNDNYNKTYNKIVIERHVKGNMTYLII